MHEGEMSSTRVSSYFILILVYLLVCYFILVGIYSMIKGVVINIPGEFLVVFGSLLSHHLILLGLNKRAEAKIKGIEISKR